VFRKYRFVELDCRQIDWWLG